MTTTSNSFDLLDERIRHYIWRQGWEALRDVQELAIPAIVEANQDVIVAAETAAGKTEAAFLPALTALLRREPMGLIVYISPLKALINDQFGRLEQLCEELAIPVWPWHGDVSGSVKQRFLKTPKGVLLITPEALEATLCNKGTALVRTFEHTAFFVIDELHAFIGSERGKQLQSLLHRIDFVQRRQVPRIGLSATLGDMSLAADFLRPGLGSRVALVKAEGSGSDLKMLVKGYIEPSAPQPAAYDPVDAAESGEGDDDDDAEAEQSVVEPTAPSQIAAHLFKVLLGSNNLIFPNRRAEVERYTLLLNKLCDEAGVPHEFWPHHGSLSKELRAETESALKQKERPATGVCTNTLELGIDIGAIKSVAQVGEPFSVASLRQRLGRSGRRAGESKILRGYVVEDELSQYAKLDDMLRLSTVQMCAMLNLLLEGWFEPPAAGGMHLSTLVQQLLSLIAQQGGITAARSYQVLCGAGAPFAGLGKAEYLELLRHLGKKELIMQDADGSLLHGRIGERMVNHYSFYAAFASDEEYRLLTKGRPLGSLPVSQMLRVGQRLLFAGKTWRVEQVDDGAKAIHVVRTRGGVLPTFSSGSGQVHTRVRQEMREVLGSTNELRYLDTTARQLVNEGRSAYLSAGMDCARYLDLGPTLILLTWLGDAANDTLAAILMSLGYTAWSQDIGVSVIKAESSTEEVFDALRRKGALVTEDLSSLLGDAKALQKEKWDWALPDSLLYKSYASLHLDIPAATTWLADFLEHV